MAKSTAFRAALREEAPSGVPQKLWDRTVRIESKLHNYIRSQEEEQMLMAQHRVRLTHMEHELATIKQMLIQLSMDFKQFKREWDDTEWADED